MVPPHWTDALACFGLVRAVDAATPNLVWILTCLAQSGAHELCENICWGYFTGGYSALTAKVATESASPFKYNLQIRFRVVCFLSHQCTRETCLISVFVIIHLFVWLVHEQNLFLAYFSLRLFVPFLWMRVTIVRTMLIRPINAHESCRLSSEWSKYQYKLLHDFWY